MQAQGRLRVNDIYSRCTEMQHHGKNAKCQILSNRLLTDKIGAFYEGQRGKVTRSGFYKSDLVCSHMQNISAAYISNITIVKFTVSKATYTLRWLVIA